MTKKNFSHYVLLLVILSLLSGCNADETFKSNNAVTNSTVTFIGITLVSNKTDSSLTLSWSIHPKALSYTLFNTASGTPVFIESINNPNINSIELTGLTPGATYKFRLKMVHSEDLIDNNKNDLTVVMNSAPVTPSTLAYNTPATSPGTDNLPIFTINGVKAGDLVKLYMNDATCSSSTIASGTVATGVKSIDLQLNSALALDGSYIFYANASNSSGSTSSCSTGLTYELLKPQCPADYIQVPGNASLGVNEDFCVAKFEMRCIGSNCPTLTPDAVATSQETGKPWAYISAPDAWSACMNLNTEIPLADKLGDVNNDGTYALISNPEWMTIARSIEDEATNWVGGVLNRGWSANAYEGDSYTHSDLAPQTNSNCLYSSAADTCALTGLHKFKRTHTLKNGEEVWDLAGNVQEFTDWLATDNSFTTGPTSCSSSWQELNAVNCPDLLPDSYMPLTASTTAQNIGVFFGGGGGVAIRGGRYDQGSSYGGLYHLNLFTGLMTTSGVYGFRCVFRP